MNIIAIKASILQIQAEIDKPHNCGGFCHCKLLKKEVDRLTRWVRLQEQSQAAQKNLNLTNDPKFRIDQYHLRCSLLGG